MLLGGLVTVWTYTTFGDLASTKAPYEPLVTYQTNIEWPFLWIESVNWAALP